MGPCWGGFSSHQNTCLSGASLGIGGLSLFGNYSMPAGAGAWKTVSSSLRGNSPPSLVMKMVTVMFTSQVRVPLKKRSFAGMCVCVGAHMFSFKCYLSITESNWKTHTSIQRGDTTRGKASTDPLLLCLHNSQRPSPDDVTALKWTLFFSGCGVQWGWTQYPWNLFAFQVWLSSLRELKTHLLAALFPVSYCHSYWPRAAKKNLIIRFALFLCLYAHRFLPCR